MKSERNGQNLETKMKSNFQKMSFLVVNKKH